MDVTSSTPISPTWTYPFPIGPFVRGHAVGGGGGGGFQIHEINQGALVRTVGVHWSNQNLRGIRLTYTNGNRSRQIGRAENNHTQLTFQPGEIVVKASLWGNGRGTRTGRIRFTTNRGQTLDVGRNTSGQTEYPMDVGSGILVGFAGRDGHDIDALSFIFLLHGFEALVSDVRYTQPPRNDLIKPTILSQVTFRNNNNTKIQIGISATISIGQILGHLAKRPRSISPTTSGCQPVYSI